MKKYLIVFSALVAASLLPAGARSDGGDFEICWDGLKKVCPGAYGRVHPLADGRLMVAYNRDSSIFARFSPDEGESWSEEVSVMSKFTYFNPQRKESVRVLCTRPDFAQLPGGDILCTVTLRPAGYKTWIHAECIYSTISKDGGKTWSDRIETYPSMVWEYTGEEKIMKGAMESSVLVLPDGRIQVYFTDNTPYYRKYLDGRRDSPSGNNISYVESDDGGMTWSAAHIVCNADAGGSVGWDCMPVLTICDGYIWLIIEHKDERGSQKAMELMMMSCKVDEGWPARFISKNSDRRFYPYEPVQGVYCGAPYITHTDDYILVCGQNADGTPKPLSEKYAYPWIHCVPRSAISGGKFNATYAAPPAVPREANPQGGALWNALCDIGGNRFILTTQYKGGIWINKGIIVKK